MIHSYFCLSESIFSWFRVSKFFFRYLWSIDNAMMHQHCVNMEAVKTIVSCLGLYSYCHVSQRLKEAMIIPIGSMYGIFTYIWLILILMVNKCRQIYYTWILWDIEFLWTRMIPDVFCMFFVWLLMLHVCVCVCLLKYWHVCVCACWNIDNEWAVWWAGIMKSQEVLIPAPHKGPDWWIYVDTPMCIF